MFLKLQSGVFSLCHHLCSKSAIAVICRIVNFGYAPICILAFRITDYSFWKYDQYKNFHCKITKLVRNIHLFG